MQSYPDLKNKVALVTGASSGIGSATALLLAASGAKVVVNYWKNQKGAAETVSAIAAQDGTGLAIKADVSGGAGCASLVEETVRKFGPVDILVNNAGSIVARRGILDLTEETWDEVLDLNLKSVYLCTRAVARSMVERKGGAIVNMASIAARNGGGLGAGPYAASKAGVIAFSKSVAKELAPHGVRVNCVAPGVIDTPLHDQFSSPEMMKGFVALIPMARVGTAAEVASVIGFLCSDASSYVCGETIEINGAQLML
jgi:3-oxoacyl-[acyl-carrier protein] reductase